MLYSKAIFTCWKWLFVYLKSYICEKLKTREKVIILFIFRQHRVGSEPGTVQQQLVHFQNGN